jgi:hypothetical protein
VLVKLVKPRLSVSRRPYNPTEVNRFVTLAIGPIIIKTLKLRAAAGGVFLLSKCANPICVTPFRYMREGRIFNVQIRSGSHREPVKIEHFWLCEKCAKTLKVVFERGAVSVRPIYLALPSGTLEKRREVA